MENHSTPTAAAVRRAYWQKIIDNPGALEHLTHLLELITIQCEAPNQVPTINDMLTTWISQAHVDLADLHTRSQLHTALSMSSFFARLRDTYEAFQIEAEEGAKEGGGGHE
ncbi:hypothetical protein [Spirosoma sp.]|uniref:hypothetical protein n=1 Tax=Spirosoma sp. TaxID=1899569 RepID=UPI00262A7CBD|nr:hypothetical protein [Spirosoma sp.]MCX6218345.1 hypothetical protein [Spirosoma sp.]